MHVYELTGSELVSDLPDTFEPEAEDFRFTLAFSVVAPTGDTEQNEVEGGGLITVDPVNRVSAPQAGMIVAAAKRNPAFAQRELGDAYREMRRDFRLSPKQKDFNLCDEIRQAGYDSAKDKPLSDAQVKQLGVLAACIDTGATSGDAGIDARAAALAPALKARLSDLLWKVIMADAPVGADYTRVRTVVTQYVGDYPRAQSNQQSGARTIGTAPLVELGSTVPAKWTEQGVTETVDEVAPEGELAPVGGATEGEDEPF